VPSAFWRPLGLEELRRLRAWKRERVNVRKDGSTFPAYLISDVVRSAHGDPLAIVTTCEDITERKWAEEQLRRAAFYDALTGLPNRALFMDRLGQALDRARRHPSFDFALLFLDLDRFKLVNDSFGHAMGDQLLQAVAIRLESCRQAGDTVARLGGDEFAFLAEEIGGATQAVHLAERVREALRSPFVVAGHELFTTASVGIAINQPGYQQPDDMLRDADTAMYRAKMGGRSHEVFDQEMHDRVQRIVQLEGELRRAVERKEFVLHYQPIVPLHNRRAAGAEALIRWRHPRRGLLQPEQFVPLAEETGLIATIGEWVLHEACAWARPRTDARGSKLRVAVNLSPRQFLQSDLLGEVSRALAASGLEPDRLELEVTETVAMHDVKATEATLRRLKELGVRIAIDDFGTGHSSLSYLKRCPVDTLKMDRSFGSGVGFERRDAAIVSSVIALAHSLGLEVVAEGVETERQLAFFRKEGCDAAQGFLLGDPRPAIERAIG
jgi:diguanylate cyclase (GGDEF)-like protein